MIKKDLQETQSAGFQTTCSSLHVCVKIWCEMNVPIAPSFLHF